MSKIITKIVIDIIVTINHGKYAMNEFRFWEIVFCPSPILSIFFRVFLCLFKFVKIANQTNWNKYKQDNK